MWIESVELDDGDRPLHAGEPHNWVFRLGSRASLPEAPLTLRGGGAEELHTVPLVPGVTEIELQWTFAEPGLQTFEAVLGSGQGEAQAQGALWRGSLRVEPRHRVLLLAPGDHSGDLERLLGAQGLQVTRSTPDRTSLNQVALRRYDAVLLSNVSADSLPEPRHSGRSGTGSRTRAGGCCSSAARRPSARRDTGIRRSSGYCRSTSRSEEERSEVALMIALDKSYSMKGPKMDLAKEATKAALGMLNEQHRFGLVAFDWHTHEIVPLQFVREQNRLADRVDRIEGQRPDQLLSGPGGLPGSTLRSRIRGQARDPGLRRPHLPGRVRAPRASHETGKRSPSPPSPSASSPDRELLADIADWGDGNAYTIEDPSSVQSILIDETMNQLPDSAREEEIRVELRGQAEALAGIDIAAAPRLYGRIAAVAKDSAEVILGAGSGTGGRRRHDSGQPLRRPRQDLDVHLRPRAPLGKRLAALVPTAAPRRPGRPRRRRPASERRVGTAPGPPRRGPRSGTQA